MKDGFLKVAAATINVTLGNVKANTQEILQYIQRAQEQNVQVLVFSELSMTGYSIEDLLFAKRILNECETQLKKILTETKDVDMFIVLGMPYVYKNNLYNTAVMISHGTILGMVPKINIPNYHEYYEARHFASGRDVDDYVIFADQEFPFATNLIFQDTNHPWIRIGTEICEDVWAPHTPSTDLCLNGATLIVNPSASNHITSKGDYRRSLISSTSARLICAYVYANAGAGESSTDVVFSGHSLIYENGVKLAESALYDAQLTTAVVDLQKMETERVEMTTYENEDEAQYIDFTLENHDIDLSERFYDPHPFVPSKMADRYTRCEEVFSIQTHGLMQRLKAIHAKTVVIGISGGLDSTLALLVAVRAFDALGIDRKNIIAITMPGFGTTSRTKNNADDLMKELGVTRKEINITDAVRVHFKDIGHDESVHDVTYENCQARERTQILMDVANQSGGIVVGTGDLSEVALGWSTYNGDHMSMYAVNVSVPKTLVRYLVDYVSSTYEGTLKDTLQDILQTPVSPELLPANDNKIVQKTEDIVGPYELHDFFLYHHARFHYEPLKLFRIAQVAYHDEYDNETIKKWLLKFYRRFFTQQFKRSCIPDGPKVGTVALSPRGDLRMPSDANVDMWLEELENI